jgi:hypothetical protein
MDLDIGSHGLVMGHPGNVAYDLRTVRLPAGARAASDWEVRSDERGDRVQILGEQDFITGEILEAHICVSDGRDSINFDAGLLPDVEAAADEMRLLTAAVAMSDPEAMIEAEGGGVA